MTRPADSNFDLDLPNLPRAICSDIPDPDVFFPGYGPTPAAVKAICSHCPEKQPCLVYALTHDVSGIWAGTSEIERKQWRRRQAVA